MVDENPIRGRFQAVRRSLAATSRATKVARSTIGRGLKDLKDLASLNGGYVALAPAARR